MTLADPDARPMETKAPPTPPSDRMEIDTRGDTMQNGHTTQDPSPDKAVALENSFHATPTENLTSYLQNNALTAEGTPDASQPDTSQDSVDVQLPISSEADLTSTAFTSSAPEQITHSATLVAKVSSTDVTDLNSTGNLVQAPISDLREEVQPATSQQSLEIKEQKLEQDLLRDPEMANGLNHQEQGQTESVRIHSEVKPAASPSPQAATVSIKDTADMETSAQNEPPTTITTAEIPHHPPVPVPEGAEVEAPIDPAPSPAQGAVNLSAPVDASISLPQTPQPSISEKVEAPATDRRTPEPVAQDVSTGENMPNGSVEHADQVMPDAPTSPTKLVRPRDEDDADGQRAVKRSKTDGEDSTEQEFKRPDRPEIVTNVNGTQTSATNPDLDKPATLPQHRQLLRILSNIKRTKDAGAFLHPVDFLSLGIPNYPSVITKPMDLGTVEEKEKKREYPTISAFISDFNQIIHNTEMFNGLEHAITQAAHRMKVSFTKQMEKLPGPEVAEPVRSDNKKKKATVPPSEKPVAPRRESRSSLPGIAQSPIAPATPTFALGPQGTPIIRRDSTLNAERPKREIHPPAPRDLPYANQKPKKKKYQMELKFCQHILNEITKPRHKAIASPFLEKVDPVALNIPNYFSIIRNPMDFGLIQHKLDHGEYENAKEFDLDAKLVFANCFKFNPPTSYVHDLGKQLEDVYLRVWKDKQPWIEKQTPASGATSAGTTPEGSDEEEEEEEEDDGQNEILKLQQQIAAMSKQVELITQKKKSPPVASKKAKAAAKPEKKPHKKAAPAPASKAKAIKPAARNGGPSKAPYVTYEQKQDISNRINSLPEAKMGQALTIIRENMPKLKGVEDDELELDIDELDNDVLYQLLQFVKKHAPKNEEPVRPKPPPAPAANTSSRKKNKPMSKVEQENRIQQVKGSLSAFDNPGAATHVPGAVSSAAHEDRDTSGDEEDSEESEEE